MIYRILQLLLLLGLQAVTVDVYSQQNYQFSGENSYSEVDIDLVHNLIIVPIEVNGTLLSFMLDSGVGSTIIFSLKEENSLDFPEVSTVYVKGPGTDEAIKALKSTGNQLVIGDFTLNDRDLYIVSGRKFSFANRLGVAVNGLIGYDVFRDLVVETNYIRKRIKIYSSEEYSYSKCRRCEDFPLKIHEGKAYLQAIANFGENGLKTQNLLLDSGLGDPLWIFNDAETNLIPEKSFEDFLGYGITGSVYGQRSRIPALKLGEFEFKDIILSFPDSIAVSQIDGFKRHGSLGAQVLGRFHTVIDYPGNNLRLKPNKYLKDDFEFNMSGLVVEHSGFHMVREAAFSDRPSFQLETNNLAPQETSYNLKYNLERQYRIAEVRPDSPAFRAGLQIGDLVKSINGRPVHKYSLDEISKLLSSKEGKKIKIIVKRIYGEYTKEFRLERLL